jgi:hypothetical protein
LIVRFAASRPFADPDKAARKLVEIANDGATRMRLPLSGDLFDPAAEAIVDNLLICATVLESVFGHGSEAAA